MKKAKRKKIQTTKKLGCKAKIWIKKLLVFPKYMVSARIYIYYQMGIKLCALLIQEDIHIWNILYIVKIIYECLLCVNGTKKIDTLSLCKF